MPLSLPIVLPKSVTDGSPGVAASDAAPHGIAALTARMARGDEDAFREFHGAWFHRLFRYVLVLMRGDEHAARDVTQESLLRVVRRVRVFECETVFWDWLTCLARSAAADHGRKTTRYRRLLDWFARRPEQALHEPEPDLLEAALETALGGLPEPDQSLLHGKYRFRLSVRELAHQSGLSEEAVESRLARARKLLRSAALKILQNETPP